MPTADICEYGFSCRYEEDLPQLEVNPRWFEAPDGTELFSIVRTPFAVTEYLNQAQIDHPKRYAAGDPDLEGLPISRPEVITHLGTYLNMERPIVDRGSDDQTGENT